MSFPFDDNDPRWTAYALGELSEEEAAELEHSPASDAFVAELRALCGELEAELGLDDDAPALDAVAREALLGTVGGGTTPPAAAATNEADEASPAKVLPWPLKLAVGGGGLAMAASALLFVGGGGVLFTPADQEPAGAHQMLSPPPPPPPVRQGVETGNIYSRMTVSGSDGTRLTDWATQAERGDGNPNVDKYEPHNPNTSRTVAQYPGYRLDQNQDIVSNNFYPTTNDDPNSVVDTNSTPVFDLDRVIEAQSGVTNSAQNHPLLDPGFAAKNGYAQLYDTNSAKTPRFEAPPENPWRLPSKEPLSTFSVDVDTGAYSVVRSYLVNNALPPPSAVRIEELINTFPYDYAPPDDDQPFAVHTELATSPLDKDRQILRVGLKGKVFDDDEVPPANLVFLIDVSGSMSSRLPMVKRGLEMLVERLDENDRVAIVVYAGASGLVLPSTSADDKGTILGALDRLQAGGGTNGAAGIELAYRVAQQQFIKGASNRVVLATDGDFNVGLTDKGTLVDYAAKKAQKGVFLSVLGFGMSNLNDAMLEQIANKANGNYAVIDSMREAEKVFVEDLAGMLHTIAKDVKIQVEFNPAKVAGYRLIGYDNRMLAARDFNDDTKDAGEIGAGHSVTALYEIIPAGGTVPGTVDALRYRKQDEETLPDSDELCFVKLRYKQPDGHKSKLLEVPVDDDALAIDATSADFRFQVAVATFGTLLRGSKHAAGKGWGDVLEWATAGVRAYDPGGHRAAFLELVGKARKLDR
jgi:Ca-activated chloride channel family protein